MLLLCFVWWKKAMLLIRLNTFADSQYYYRLNTLGEIADVRTSKGVVIGYEVRPLYSPLDFGYADVLDISYILQDNTVTVRIRLIPELDRPPFREDAPFLFRFMR